MDYSLLINIESSNDGKANKVNNKLTKNNFFVSRDGTEYYHIGIIDYLQKFDMNKKVENYVKTIRNKRKASLISCVDPKTYSNRFVNFCQKNVIGESTTRFDLS